MLLFIISTSTQIAYCCYSNLFRRPLFMSHNLIYNLWFLNCCVKTLIKMRVAYINFIKWGNLIPY